MIVELDEPKIKNKSSIDENKIEELTSQENNLDGDAFFYEYKTVQFQP